jgi:hypothetical protein
MMQDSRIFSVLQGSSGTPCKEESLAEIVNGDFSTILIVRREPALQGQQVVLRGDGPETVAISMLGQL